MGTLGSVIEEEKVSYADICWVGSFICAKCHLCYVGASNDMLAKEKYFSLDVFLIDRLLKIDD